MSQPAITSEALLRQLNWRYAVKKFDPAKKIPAETWRAIEEAMILSPSSYGLQPWKFVVITDPGIKDKLPAISWNQSQPRDCSHMVVFASKKGIGAADVEKYVKSIMAVRGATEESLKDFKGMMLGTVTKTPPEQLDAWTARQVYIALGFAMAAAAVLGVDACPMEGIVGPEYDKLLGLEKLGYSAVVGCAMGYRASDDWLASMKKVRFSAGDVVVRI